MKILHYVIHTLFLSIFVNCQHYTLEYGELTYPIDIQEQQYDEGSYQDRNIYTYNINNYGINSMNDDFIVGIWVQYVGYLSSNYLIMSLNNGYVYVYIYNNYFRIGGDSGYFGQYYPQYNNYWTYVYFSQSISQSQNKICIIEPLYNSSSYCITVPFTEYFLFSFLQTTYYDYYSYGLCGWQGYANSIVAKKLYINFNTVYSDLQFLTIVSIEEPYILLDIRLNERRQFLSPKDWSDSQYFIQMGSSIDVDSNDPIYILEQQCLSFTGNQYLLIDDFKLYQTYTIELQILVPGISEYFILNFRIKQQNQDLLILFASNNYFTYYAPLQGSQFYCYLDTSLKTIFAFIDLFDKIHVIFIQNNQILCYNKHPGDFFQFSQVNQFLIGSRDYINSNSFYLYSLRISKGFWIPTQYLEDQVCLYSINKCFTCLNGLILFEGQCVSECPTDYELNAYKNECVPRCHPTCLTCDITNPSQCLICSGIRINPPDCNCPGGYFDDFVTPECINIMKDQTVDSGIVEFQCSSIGDNYFQVYFSKYYYHSPKVIISLLGHLDSDNNREFQVFINEISNTYFVMRYICSSYLAFLRVQWMSGDSQYFLSSVQTDTSGQFSSFSMSYSNGLNQVICNLLGWCINNSYSYSYIEMIINRLSQNLFQFFGNYPFYVIKYQFFEFKDYMNYELFYSLDTYKQQNGFSVGGSQITLGIQQIPQNIPNILLTKRFYCYNTLPPQFWITEQRKLGFLQYNLKNYGQTIFQNLDVNIIFAGVYCNQYNQPCNYYEQLNKCNLILNSCSCGQYQYYHANQNLCIDCDSNCLTCDIISTNCLTCHPEYNYQLYQNPSTLYMNCGCLINQYYDINDVCQDCDPNCQQCQSESTFCTLCYPPAILDIYNVCVCDLGFISTVNGCEQCLSPCATCETTVTNCLTCQYSGQLIPTCQCPTGQQVITTICEQFCPILCLSCTTQTSCDSCVSNSSFNTTSNACECVNGYFSDGISCLQCQSPCLTCTSLVDCSSCIDQTYYLSGTTCYNCLIPCLQCSSSTSCLSCIDNTLYLLNNACYTCISPCLTCSSDILCNSCINNNYYLDTTQQCQICISPCLQCDSSTFCISCINTLYYLSSSNTCLSCNFPCLNCSSQTQCIDCQIGYYLDSLYQCQQCVSPCLQCTSATICTQCSSGYYIDSSNVCQLCTQPCLDCLSTSTNCLSCVDVSMTLINGGCSCSSTQYFDISTLLCQNCHPTCTSCTTSDHCCLASNLQQLNVTTNACECVNGYYLNLNACSQCVSPCNFCSSSTVCLSCINGYYLSSQSCLSCVSPCATCITTSTQCLTCVGPNMILSNADCVCGSQSYMDTTLQDCVACHPTCTTCIDSTNCCFASEFKQLVGTVCECMSGYYQDINLICQKCDINCVTCEIDSKNCTSCDTTQTLLNGKCICSNTHQYLDVNSKCQECSVNCLTCELAVDNCLTCDLTKKLTLQQGICKCLSNEYLDSQGVCQLCYKTCSTCSNGLSNGCLSCIPSRILNPENRQCECKDGYFKNDLDECDKCNVKCKTCINDTQCLICASNSSFNSDNTDCICDEGYFQNELLLCQKCQPPCKTCTSSLDCLSCLDETREFIGSKCQCKKEYFENTSQQCELCSSQNGKVNDICNYVNCGDGELTKGEECDDGNKLSRDGCTDCKVDSLYTCVNKLLARSICFKCVENCKSCSLKGNRSSCDICYDGYFLKNDQCIKCADSCFTCSDIKTCVNCTIIDAQPDEKGLCPKCNDVKGYYIVNRKCITKCGDAIIVDSEFCDDGNTINGDGCNSKCEVEKYYSCKQSTCTKIPQDEVIADYVNSTTTDNLALKFPTSQGNPCTKINITIDQFLPTDFFANITFIQVDETQSSCDIDFQFNRTIDVGNIIHILIPVKIKTSRLLQEEEVREVIVTPRKKIIYSQSQVKQAESASDAQSTLGGLLYYIAPTAILLGGFGFFWTIMDILSWVNNLYYINIYFPENVRIFFQKSAWGDFQLFPAFFVLNEPTDPYYVESPKKFMEKGVDPIFLNNTWTCFAIIAITIGLYIVSCFIVLFLELIWPLKYVRSATALKIFYLNDQNPSSVSPQRLQSKGFKQKRKVSTETDEDAKQKIPQLANRFPYLIEKIYTPLNNFKINFKSNLIKSLNLAFLDLVLAITLQLTTVPGSVQQYQIVQINQMLSYSSVLICIITLIISYYVTTKHHLLLDNKTFENQYGTLYENINTRSSTAMLYSFINLIRKALFIIVVVYFYYQPLLQTVFCCCISFLNVALILYENPFTSRADLIQNGVPDFCIFVLMLLSTGFAVDDIAGILDANQRFQIGWIMIGTIGLSIFTQIMFLLRQFVQDLIDKSKFFIQKLRNLFTKKA